MMDSRRMAGGARAALRTEAEELESALRLFFRVPSVRSRKRARSGLQAESEAPGSGQEAHLKRVKQLLRDAGAGAQEALVQRVYDVVTAHLEARKVSPAVLERVLQLSGELFRRSAAFRKLVAAQASQFYARLLTAAGEDGEAVRTSGGAAKRSTGNTQLEAVLERIEEWKEDFGARYLPLVAGYDVLAARGYEFPRVRATQAAAKQRAQQTQAHRGRVHELKAQQRRREMAQLVPEMETLLSEMHQVFEILIPTLDAFQVPDAAVSPPSEPRARALPPLRTDSPGEGALPGQNEDEQALKASSNVLVAGASVESDDMSDAGDDDGIEWESVDPDDEDGADRHGGVVSRDEEDDGRPREDMDMNEIVQAYGLGSSSYQLTIEIPTSVCERSAENEVLFRTLADGMLRLRKRFLPLVGDWLAYSSSSEAAHPSAASERDRDERRELQDLHARLRDVELKWEDLVRESERKRFARITPAVVTVPSDAYDPQLPDGPRKRRATAHCGESRSRG